MSDQTGLATAGTSPAPGPRPCSSGILQTRGVRRPGQAGSGWTCGAAVSGRHAVGPPAHPVPGTWAGHGDASGARHRCCSRSPRCAPGTCSGQCRPASGGRACEAGPGPSAPPQHPPTRHPSRCTHRPVEAAPAVHGHVEARVHSLEDHDAHADGADLNDAWGWGGGAGLRAGSPPSIHPHAPTGPRAFTQPLR